MGTARDILGGEGGQVKETPGVLSRERGRQFAELAGSFAGTGIKTNLQSVLEQNLMSRPSSPYQSALQSRMLSPGTSPYQSALQSRLNAPESGPYQEALQRELTGAAQFGGLSESENNLVNQAYSGRQAQFNALGIGASPLAQSAIAAAGAPTLVGLRQQRIQDLMAGQGQFQQNQQSQAQNLLAGQGQFDTQQQNQTQNLLTGQGQLDAQQNQFLQNLMQSIQQGMAQRGQTLGTYLNLAQLGQPQTTGVSGRSPWDVSVKLPGGAGGGIGGG